LNASFKKFFRNLDIIFYTIFIIFCVDLVILKIFFIISFKKLLLLFLIGCSGGIAEVVYIEAQIRRKKLLGLVSIGLLIILSVTFFMFMPIDVVIFEKNYTEILQYVLYVVGKFFKGGTIMGSIVVGYFGVLFIYIKLIRKDIHQYDIKLLPYSIIYG